MTTQFTTPSYVRKSSDVSLDDAARLPELLASGELQREARDFLLWVIKRHGDTRLEDMFEKYRQADPDDYRLPRKIGDTGHFLGATVALAIIDDLSLVAHHLVDKKVDPSKVAYFITNKFYRACEIDFVHHFKNKGPLPVSEFCDLFGIEPEHLAIKIVIEDDAQAYQVFAEENDLYLPGALAMVPYTPLSAIRALGDLQPDPVSTDEMMARIVNQFSVFHIHEAPINTSLPSKLVPGHGIRYEELKVIDHKLGVFPGYLPLLRERASHLVNEFTHQSTLDLPRSPEQNRLIIQIMDDFEKAGISRVDILMLGLGMGGGLAVERYNRKTPEERQAMYHRALVNHAAVIGDGTPSQSMYNKLFQINHLINKEPIEALEAQCREPADWHALYRATHDSKYLKHLSTRIEKVFSSDLGL